MPRKKKEREQNEIGDLIQSNFAVKNSKLEKNVGKIGLYCDRQVKIIGVQKMWDYDVNGSYTFGVLGYRVEEIEPQMIDEKHRLYPCFPVSVRDLKIIDNVYSID